MTRVVSILTKIYSQLLRLYPSSFRDEFVEEMLTDFSDMAKDASQKGIFSLTLFYLKEIADFPINLLRILWSESPVFKLLRSQPAKSGLRGAFGFGIGFAVTSIVGWKISHWLFSALDPALQSWSIWYYDTFRTEKGIFLFQDLLSLMFSAVMGIIFGLFFALILGNRTKFYRYMIATALGWTIPTTVSSVLGDSFGWPYFLSEGQMWILGYSQAILPGLFLSAAFIIAESDRKEPFRYLVAGAVIYPLGTFLFIKLLFSLWLEITPWFFISLMALMILLIGGVVAVAMLSNRDMLFVVLAGAIGYYVLNRAAFYVSYSLLQFPSAPMGVGITQEAFNVYQLYGTLNQAIFGALFGLVLGLILGYQRKNNPPQIAAGI